MNFVEIVFLSIALSVDAAVCSIIGGKNKDQSTTQKWRGAAVLGFAFGFSQFLMPVIGFFCGETVMALIEQYDHWVAFTLLSIVSLNMLKEALMGANEKTFKLSLWMVISLAVATSIDALAVGFILSIVDSRIFYIAGIIGFICFMISFTSFLLGTYLSKFTSLDRILNILGALTLMGIGFGILYEHGVFV